MAERRQDNMTRTRNRIYRQGFHKAISYLYQRANQGEKVVFRAFLDKYLQANVDEFIAPINETGCPRGQCSDGAGGCVECPESGLHNAALNEQPYVEGDEKPE